MGSSSERCALTGLEISGGDAVYLAVIDEKFDLYEGHMVLVPPVKGTYDDYIGLILTEDVPLLGLHKGEEYAPFHDGKTVVFFNARIFEAIKDLEPEMAFTAATVGDQIEASLAAMRDGIEQLLAEDLDPSLMGLKLERYSWLNTWRGAKSLLQELLEQQRDLASFFELARRTKLMKAAEFELRRPISPIRVGPQHNGAAAQRQMTRLALDILDDQGRERADWHNSTPGAIFDQPFSFEQDEAGGITIMDAEDLEVMSLPVPASTYDPSNKDGPQRARAFAEWMIARLNAPATEIGK